MGYIGLYYAKTKFKWCAQRWSKHENKMIFKGYYANEETAARASDTLARQLMKNGEDNHKLNFPSDDFDVNPERKKRYKYQYVGVSYHHDRAKGWCARRWSKNENKMFYNGYYENEETAAHASDTLAKQLMRKGERSQTLNFPEDDTEIYPEEKHPKYFGVSYNKNNLKWYVCRHSKIKKTTAYNGYYDSEEAAARASDTLAMELLKNGEEHHKLNFADDDHIENASHKNKRKRAENLEDSQDK